MRKKQLESRLTFSTRMKIFWRKYEQYSSISTGRYLGVLNCYIRGTSHQCGRLFPAQTTNSTDSCASRASSVSSSRRKCFDRQLHKGHRFLAIHSTLYVTSHLTHRRLIKPKWWWFRACVVGAGKSPEKEYFLGNQQTPLTWRRWWIHLLSMLISCIANFPTSN